MTEYRTITIITNRCDGSIGGPVVSQLENLRKHGQGEVPILVSDQSPQSLNAKNSNYSQLSSISKEYSNPIIYIGQKQFQELAGSIDLGPFEQPLLGSGYANARVRSWLSVPQETKVIVQQDDDEFSVGEDIVGKFSSCIGKFPAELKVKYAQPFKTKQVQIVGGPYLGKLGLQVDAFENDPKAFSALSRLCHFPEIYLKQLFGRKISMSSFKYGKKHRTFSFNGGNVAIGRQVFSEVIPPLIGPVHGDDLHFANLITCLGYPMLRYNLPVDHKHAQFRSNPDWISEYWTRPIRGMDCFEVLGYALLKARGFDVDTNKRVSGQFLSEFRKSPLKDTKQLFDLFETICTDYSQQELVEETKTFRVPFYQSVADIMLHTKSPAIREAGDRLKTNCECYLRDFTEKILEHCQNAPLWPEKFQEFQESYDAYDFRL